MASSYFELPQATNMISDFLGSTPSQTGFLAPTKTPVSSFTGTFLDPSFGQNIFKNLPDYSNVFNRAAAGITSPISGGITSTPTTPSNPYQPTRMPSRRQGSSGSAGPMIFGAPPIEFSLGVAPELGKLEVDFETLGKRALEANKPFAEQYKQFAPQTEAGTRAISQAGARMATGQLPADLTGEVGRSAAALGYQAGVGPRSQMGRNILARDLGLTSLQVQQAGQNLLERSSALAQQAMQAMAPIAPQQVFQSAFGQAQYNQEIANQNLLNAWMSRPLPGQFDITKGAYVGFAPQTYSATRPLIPGTSLTGRQGLFNVMADQAIQNWQGSLASNPMFG